MKKSKYPSLPRKCGKSAITSLVLAILVFLSVNVCEAGRIITMSTSQDLSAAALSYTFNFPGDGRFLWCQFHASEAISETISVTSNNKAGANYDTLLKSYAWSSGTDYFWAPSPALEFEAGHGLVFGVTNANTTGTVYLTIQVEIGR